MATSPSRGAGRGSFSQWRKGMTDEEWVALHASADDDWYRSMEHDFGLEPDPGTSGRTESWR